MNKQKGAFGKSYSSPEVNSYVITEDVMFASGDSEDIAPVEWDSAQWDNQGGGN